jgi:hypothetical protein
MARDFALFDHLEDDSRRFASLELADHSLRRVEWLEKRIDAEAFDIYYQIHSRKRRVLRSGGSRVIRLWAEILSTERWGSFGSVEVVFYYYSGL